MRNDGLRDYQIPVIKLMKSGKTHLEAFEEIANKLSVRRTTVFDRCVRGLGLEHGGIQEFNVSVKSGRIIQILKNKYPQRQNLIDSELGRLYESKKIDWSDRKNRVAQSREPFKGEADKPLNEIIAKDTVRISENDVLIATTLWLVDRGGFYFQCSPARGQGTNYQDDTERLRATLLSAGVSKELITMRPNGQDVVAFSKTEFWQIECKGAGGGKQSTQRNNFDRALASVVSYFEDSDETTNYHTRLGLALPATPTYLHLLNERVRKPLRKRLNLWVLLFDPLTKSICAVSPDEEYPIK